MNILILPIIILLFFPLLLLGGWVWMLCLGALADIFNQPDLAISFWNSVIVAFITFILFGGSARSS